ncbi:MAG: transporter [Sphingomonas bacterium]|nr:transporter [Sphingomonas bacterium]
MSPIYRAALCAASLALAGQPASAQIDTAAPVLTLEEALARAQGSSPTTEAATAGLRIADAQRDVARLRPNPSLEGMTENVAGTGIYRGFRSSETTIGLALPIELGGKRSARIAVAAAQGDRAQLDALVAAAELRLRVSRAYNDASAAQQRVGTAREQLVIATEGLRVARVRVRAGSASPLEEQRAEVARINAESAAERTQRTADVALANLGRIIGAPVFALDQSWFRNVAGFGPAQPITADGTLAAATARAAVSAADAQVRLAQSQRVPDVTFSASARRIEETNDRAAVFGLSVPLPLFNNGRAAVDLAAAQRWQADATRRATLLDAEREIATAQADLANAATTARVSTGPALAAATEAARIARIGYREGKFGQLDLLEAERTLADTRGAAIDALAAYHDAQARLERLTAAAPASTGNSR